MPIRPENRERYPLNWPEISRGVRERAGNKCEGCGVANYAIGGRSADGTFLPVRPKGEKLLRIEWPAPGEWWWCGAGERVEMLRIIRIVLTVAHLDHRPENCAPANLRAWCQRCHNRYDAATRRAGIAHRAREAAAVADLFERNA